MYTLKGNRNEFLSYCFCYLIKLFCFPNEESKMLYYSDVTEVTPTTLGNIIISPIHFVLIIDFCNSMTSIALIFLYICMLLQGLSF